MMEQGLIKNIDCSEFSSEVTCRAVRFFEQRHNDKRFADAAKCMGQRLNEDTPIFPFENAGVLTDTIKTLTSLIMNNAIFEASQTHTAAPVINYQNILNHSIFENKDFLTRQDYDTYLLAVSFLISCACLNAHNTLYSQDIVNDQTNIAGYLAFNAISEDRAQKRELLAFLNKQEGFERKSITSDPKNPSRSLHRDDAYKRNNFSLMQLFGPEDYFNIFSTQKDTPLEQCEIISAQHSVIVVPELQNPSVHHGTLTKSTEGASLLHPYSQEQCYRAMLRVDITNIDQETLDAAIRSRRQK